MLPIFHKRGYENGALKVRFQETGIPGTHKRPQGQGWAMDPEGYSYVTFTRPTSPHFYQGIALKNGAMYVSTVLSDDDYRVGGLRIGRDGALKVSAASAASEGLLIASDGTLAVAGLSFFAPLSDAGSGEVDLGILGTGSATFTRATTATTINSAGLIVSVASGVPRSWYWPNTLAYGGYLAEGARTNLCLQSEDLATTWTNVRSSESVNATVSPDGATTADKLVEDATAANTHLITQAITYTAAVHTFSVFAKAAERSWILLVMGDGTTTVTCYFDIGTGAVGTAANGSGAIQAYPNGWYRCSLTTTAAFLAAAGSFQVRLSTGAAGQTYDGDGTSGAFLWGAQLEAATFASSYIPTTTASVTRNADVLTYVFAGNADATQGTAYAELGTLHSGVTGVANFALAFAAGNRLMGISSAGASTTIGIDDGTTGANKTGLTNLATASRKRASSWGSGGQVITGDGATVATAAFDGDIGSTAIAVGCSTSGSANWFGPIKNVAIMDSQFTSQQLVDMTA